MTDHLLFAVPVLNNVEGLPVNDDKKKEIKAGIMLFQEKIRETGYVTCRRVLTMGTQVGVIAAPFILHSIMVAPFLMEKLPEVM